MTSTTTPPSTTPLLTIGGDRRDTGVRIGVINPATGEQFAEVPSAGAAELDEAVAAAEAASAGWESLDADERSSQVLAFAAAVRDHHEELARLLTLEQGKPLSRSRGEITSGLKWVEWAARNPLPVHVREEGGERIEVRRIPVGVVGAITAWNYPQMLALIKIGPALATGNTVIVKPSPFTPLSTLRLGEIAQEVLPAGVVQVLAGGDELGRALTTHPGVHKISFTGSVATGKAIMAAAAATLKRVTLELGGNDAGIVLDDVDPAVVAADLYAAGLSNAGQVCAGLKRLYVPASRVGEYAEALGHVAAQIVVGNGLDDGVDMGPVQNAQQLAKVKSLVDISLGQGAEITFRGEAPAGAGYWHPVTLMRAERDSVPVVAQEQFGPVLPILGYETVDEAVSRANGTTYGLGASVWSPDVEKATSVARRLRAGSVWNNTHPNLSPDVPFGGIRESGLGVESGVEGLLAYTDVSVLRIRH
jgi:acyl-CoA reductase-like NAD-dependent aldehyde dehydrogenase